MKIHHYPGPIPVFKHPVLTIGTFDGVHYGHQRIISRIREIASEINGESVLLTFHPHPRMILDPENNGLQLLNTLVEKSSLLESYGIDHLIIARFSEEFSKLTPKEYIEDFLVNNMRPEVFVIGYDHHFGNKRSGNIESIRKYSTQFGYRVIEIPGQLIEDIAVSSTRIRMAVLEGRITEANKLLGHNFTLSGKVISGEKIGTELGFPTANIQISDPAKIIPAQGVYAVRAIHKGNTHNGMLYIGNRPTFDGQKLSIEVNIFDLDQDLYDDFLKIELISEIRGDIKFGSTEELTHQMKMDKNAVLELLKDHG